MKNTFEKLANVFKKNKIECEFTILEIGAMKLKEDLKERFYILLDYFPSSKIIGFEIDKDVCDKMNSENSKGIKYYPYALGEKNEKRKLYNTQHPMCTSLYKPNENFINLYNNLHFANLKNQTEIETITLDTFVNEYSIGDIDLIKIDVQGAELEIFKGGINSLKDVLKIICEVEFVSIYENQPLFGDESKFLKQYDFMFNKFLNLSGRSLKPLIANKDPNIASQHMWSDAVFVYHIEKINELSDEKLLKLCLLSSVYNSIDLAFFCLSIYDKRNSSTLSTDWINP
tara:strand:- start:688 stop:1545 length:858 start_codon:yes stop_codon:yes gene_type:complete